MIMDLSVKILPAPWPLGQGLVPRRLGRSILVLMALVTACGSRPNESRPTPSGNRSTEPVRPELPRKAAPSARSDRKLFSRVKMPCRVLYLARHGRSHSNTMGQINGASVPDGLDRVGYRQRVGLFALLRRVPLSAIYVSGLPRTAQTAALLAASSGLELRRRAELDEFRGGIFEGICKDFFRPVPKDGRHGCDPSPSDGLSLLGGKLLEKEAKKAAGHPLTYRAPGGGESIRDVTARLRRFLGGIPADMASGTILVVGHGGTNRFLLGLLLGLDPMRARRIRQRHDQVFRLTRKSPGSPPSLELWQSGTWTPCHIDRPDLGRGLDCMVPAGLQTTPSQATSEANGQATTSRRPARNRATPRQKP